ncbi:MAG: site-2 protease family protein [Candidatus Omnitrophica bacterium]|nr:site-2 protease family protein [Candidatus Omnitrophota bacterium]
MLITTILILLVAMTVHEVSHGFVAFWLGDDTAKRAGRLTLNPLRHIDPFWTVLFPALLYFTTGGRFMIGMAKPVPVNFLKLRNPRRDTICVALAGPLVNIAMAVVLAWLYGATHHVVWLYGVYLNLGLGVFNLIPIPPLDGSRVLAGLFPAQWARAYFKVERFGFLLIILFDITGLLMPFVKIGIDVFCRLLQVPTLTQWLHS